MTQVIRVQVPAWAPPSLISDSAFRAGPGSTRGYDVVLGG
jgi:hypothetical protein